MKISILIPFLNEERFIKEAIRSIKKQTYKNFECILIDNGSTDNSKTIAEKEIGGDNRFKLIAEQKKGIDKALNKGATLAKGEIISFLDADDWYEKEYLEFVLREMEEKKADVFFSSSTIHDERKGEKRDFTPYWFLEENFPYLLFLENRIRSMSYITIKKSSLLKILPFKEDFNLALDYYIAISSIINGFKIVFSEKKLVNKRYHRSNLAYNRFLSDMQDIKLKDFYLKNYKPLRDYFSKKELEIIFTKHYIKGASDGRRRGLLKELKTYMKDFVKSGYIREEFFIYFSSLHSINNHKTEKLEKIIKALKKEHPIFDFLKGFFYELKGMYDKSLSFFEKAFIGSFENFPEALNSYGVIVSKFRKSKAESVFRYLIEKFPYYLDAKKNYYELKRENFVNLKHTLYLMPDTLNFFLYS